MLNDIYGPSIVVRDKTGRDLHGVVAEHARKCATGYFAAIGAQRAPEAIAIYMALAYTGAFVHMMTGRYSRDEGGSFVAAEVDHVANAAARKAGISDRDYEREYEQLRGLCVDTCNLVDQRMSSGQPNVVLSKGAFAVATAVSENLRAKGQLSESDAQQLSVFLGAAIIDLAGAAMRSRPKSLFDFVLGRR